MHEQNLTIHSPEELEKMEKKLKARMVPIPNEELETVKKMGKPERREWIDKQKRARKSKRQTARAARRRNR